MTAPTQAAVAVDAVATSQAAVTAVVAAPVTDVAEGTDAQGAQLVQAAVVASDVEADAAPDADAEAGVKLGGAVKVEAEQEDGLAVEVDADAEASIAAVGRPALPTGTQQASAAAAQAQVQLQAASEAGEDGGGDAAAPRVIEAAPAQAQPLTTTSRGEQAVAALRLRETPQAEGLQHRIDHIAEQLATRLRLSHAAGGSSVNLSLKPRELGDVTVQMKVREGVVAATVLVDNADTLQALSGNLEELKQVARGAGPGRSRSSRWTCAVIRGASVANARARRFGAPSPCHPASLPDWPDRQRRCRVSRVTARSSPRTCTTAT